MSANSVSSRVGSHDQREIPHVGVRTSKRGACNSSSCVVSLFPAFEWKPQARHRAWRRCALDLGRVGRVFGCLIALAFVVGFALDASTESDDGPVTLEMSTIYNTVTESFIFAPLKPDPFDSFLFIEYRPHSQEFSISLSLGSDNEVDAKYGFTEVSFSPALSPVLDVNDADISYIIYFLGEIIVHSNISWVWSGVTADFQDFGLVTLTISRGGPPPSDPKRAGDPGILGDPDTGVCNRTPQVRDAIFDVLNKRRCEDITTADLASIKYLDLGIRRAGNIAGRHSDKAAITALKSGDFAGLSGLEELNLGNNSLATLPGDVFAGLSSLKKLHLSGNDLTALPVNVFAGLSSLEVLSLGDNNLTALDVSLFAGLSRLGWLDLAANRLTSLPAWVFRGLANLKRLDLQEN